MEVLHGTQWFFFFLLQSGTAFSVFFHLPFFC